MLKRVRQAGRLFRRLLHHPLRLFGTLLLVLLIGFDVVSWRLQQGPVELPFLAARIGAAASGFQPGLIVAVGHAGLAWEGFHTGGAPLDLRLSAISLRTPKGTVISKISRLRVTLAPLALLRGRIAPIRIIARHTAIALRPQPRQNAIQALRTMAVRLSTGLKGKPPAGHAKLDIDQLRLIRIVHADIALDDRQADLHLAAHDGTVTLRRMENGVIMARASAVFHGAAGHGAAGDGVSGNGASGAAMPVRLAYDALAGHGVARAVIGPGSLAEILPQVKPLAALRLPVTIKASLPFAARQKPQARKPQALTLRIAFGKGEVGIAQGAVPVDRADFSVAVNRGAMRLTQGVIRLGGHWPVPPVISVTGSAAYPRAMITASADRVEAGALRDYWPAGLARNTRKFVLNRIKAGVASDGVFHFGISFNPRTYRVRLDHLDGRFDATGVTFKWLKGMPPMNGLAGTLHFPDKDDLRIHVNSGHVNNILLSKAWVVIDHIEEKRKTAAVITGIAAGPVQGAVALFTLPRAHYASNDQAPGDQAPGDQAPGDRAPFGMGVKLRAARGLVSAHVNLRIPIKKHLTLKDMQLLALAHLTRFSLPLPLGKLALHDGDIRVQANFRQVSMTGTGKVSDQPARFSGVFTRTGTQRFTLRAATGMDRVLLADAGYPSLGWSAIAAPIIISMSGTPRQAEVALRVDLSGQAFALPALDWSKPAGAPGQAALSVIMRGGKATIQQIAASAPGLMIAARGESDAIIASAFDIGRSRATGKIIPPQRPGMPWRIALAGPVLDLSGAVAKAANFGAADSGVARRPGVPIPWRLRAAFNQLILRKQSSRNQASRNQVSGNQVSGTPSPDAISALNLQAAGSGSLISAMRATALLAQSHHVEMNVLPARLGRNLRVETSDGGALLQAFGIADTLDGGNLDLAANDFNGRLAGRLTMTDFRLRHAPLIGKVLQGATLYGLAEATSGPGLAFSRLIAPFTLARQVLTIRDGRAYSASLGVTMAGQVNLRHKGYNLGGTIVPAYALNSLPGRIPLLGRLFRASKGSGLFSARYTVDGPFASPHIVINPLAALAPGVFGKIFGSGPPNPLQTVVPNVNVKNPP